MIVTLAVTVPPRFAFSELFARTNAELAYDAAEFAVYDGVLAAIAVPLPATKDAFA